MAKGLFDCTGKVTMVTGGNGGIGLGFAMGVAKQGGDIAIWARNAEKNAAAKAELLAAGAGRVDAYVVDVSTEEAIVAALAARSPCASLEDCAGTNTPQPARRPTRRIVGAVIAGIAVASLAAAVFLRTSSARKDDDDGV